MKTYTVLLALLLHAGSAGAQVFQYLYIEANEGGSSGGHVALQFGGEVFHYQYTGGLIRLFKQDAEDFRFDYRFLQNRTLHVADIAVSEQTYRRLYEHFKLRFFEQERQSERLREAQQDRLLSAWLLRRISAENPAAAGFPDASLQLKGAGLFFSDSDFAPVKKPQGECRSETATAKILSQLRQSLERQHGADFLPRQEAALTDVIRRLSPTPNTVDLSRHTRREAGIQRYGRQASSYPCSLDSGNPPAIHDRGRLCRNDVIILKSTVLPSTPPQSGTPAPVYAFSERYSDLLSALLALRVVREARPLAIDACFVLQAPEWRLDNREIQTLQALQRRILETSLTLTVSKRPDWGYALLVTMARLVAIEQSLRSGRWVLADDFKQDSTTITPTQFARHAGEIDLQRDDALNDLRAARSSGALDEHGYSRIEMAANRYREWLQGESGQTVRYRGEQPLPVKSIRLPDMAFPELSPQQLRSAIHEQEDYAQQLTRRLEQRYAYNLLTRNCVTEIFRVIDAALAPETEQRLGGRIDAAFSFIPFTAFAKVRETYRVIKTAELPAYRQLQLAKQYAGEFDALVYAREANILSATLYDHNPDDAWFVFFTDDAFLLRPLFGTFNTLAGIGQSAYGLLLWPFDGGAEFKSGARGILMSLPELAFFNMRKGSYRYLSQRRLTSPLTSGH